MGAVLVAGDHHAGDLAVQRELAGHGVAVLVAAVEALDDELGHRAAHAEPDRRADDDDVGGLELRVDLRPLVSRAHVRGDAEGDVVVDDADDLALDSERRP